MKNQGFTLRPFVLLTALSALVGAQVGCQKMMFWRSDPQVMHSGTGVPAGEGTVRVSEGDNGNTKVSIRVKHLAPPSKIEANSTVYIVWIQPMDGNRQNVGALAVDKDLEGSLDTLTPHRRFKISITPEPNRQVAEPSHEPVFTYNVESNQ